jgi:hypothetical protein
MRVLLVAQSEQGSTHWRRGAVVRPDFSAEFVAALEAVWPDLRFKALPKSDGHLRGADGAVE